MKKEGQYTLLETLSHFFTALGRPAGTGSYVNESARRVQDFTNFND